MEVRIRLHHNLILPLLWSLLLSCFVLAESTSSNSTTLSTSSTLVTPSVISTATTASTPSHLTPSPYPTICTPPTHCVPCSPAVTIVLGLLSAVSLLACLILVFVLCWTCHKRGDNMEIKKYVFEEGVPDPALWVNSESSEVDTKSVDPQPSVWEASTFSPSPNSKSTTMLFPNGTVNGNESIQAASHNGHENIQPNGNQETQLAPRSNDSIKPIPVPPVQVKKKSRFRPKRVAPPPPKMSKRKKLRRNKYEEETAVYAVPSPYVTPRVHGREQATENGYDIPITHKNKFNEPHIYKSIDESKKDMPNPYADLVVSQGK